MVIVFGCSRAFVSQFALRPRAWQTALIAEAADGKADAFSVVAPVHVGSVAVKLPKPRVEVVVLSSTPEIGTVVDIGEIGG